MYVSGINWMAARNGAVDVASLLLIFAFSFYLSGNITPRIMMNSSC
jgi:hypothetical protein